MCLDNHEIPKVHILFLAIYFFKYRILYLLVDRESREWVGRLFKSPVSNFLLGGGSKYLKTIIIQIGLQKAKQVFLFVVKKKLKVFFLNCHCT